jgi:asparagine synthase (glutamine-hydrolysing)
MCGIAGIFDLRGRPVGADEIEKMSRTLIHRGPDDSGVFVDRGVALAGRRLAIIDLSPAAGQPLVNEDQSVRIVYNGEVYNFRELGRELRGRGHEFRSRTDTEVVLHAYEEWGADCVKRLNGMFAFAIWDERLEHLFLARDRYGIKPLYYAYFDDRFLFASEVKALLAAGIPRRVSIDALIEYFTFQNVFSDQTLFDRVRIVPPAHTLTVGREAAETGRYWDFDFVPDHGRSEADWKEAVETVMTEAVERQLVSDVDVGSFLSGGMDSASVVAAASKRLPRMATFTGGFDLSSVSGIELVFDERAEAEALASEFRTEHYEMVIHEGDMWWVLPELIWHLEDLRVGMSYQNYYIARLASRFVKVALAGTGGDEMFGGYPWRYDFQDLAGDPQRLRDAHYSYWNRLVDEENRTRLFTSSTWKEIDATRPRRVYEELVQPTDGIDALSMALYFEAKTFLHGLLVVEDKVSMAHSLEVRVPFLDNGVVDLALTIPSALKVRNSEGKWLLREAMRPHLPQRIVDKKKQGFSPPDESWYRGNSMTTVADLLLDERTLERGFFEPRFIRRILAEHVAAERNHRLLIWSLISFEWWNRLFMDTPSTSFDDAGTAKDRRRNASRSGR